MPDAIAASRAACGMPRAQGFETKMITTVGSMTAIQLCGDGPYRAPRDVVEGMSE